MTCIQVLPHLTAAWLPLDLVRLQVAVITQSLDLKIVCRGLFEIYNIASGSERLFVRCMWSHCIRVLLEVT